jgi:ATP-dependent protease Clp ATPase subunit
MMIQVCEECTLRSILEAILLDPMFELPGLSGVSEIVINRDAASLID